MTIDEQLTADLWVLDAMLTGKDPRSGRGDPNKLIQIERFQMGEMHYLSDGGYSRVFCSYRGEILLSSESRNEVKALWNKDAVQGVVFRIERRVEKWQLANNCKI